MSVTPTGDKRLPSLAPCHPLLTPGRSLPTSVQLSSCCTKNPKSERPSTIKACFSLTDMGRCSCWGQSGSCHLKGDAEPQLLLRPHWMLRVQPDDREGDERPRCSPSPLPKSSGNGSRGPSHLHQKRRPGSPAGSCLLAVTRTTLEPVTAAPTAHSVHWAAESHERQSNEKNDCSTY